jgi:hypothetical protein
MLVIVMFGYEDVGGVFEGKVRRANKEYDVGQHVEMAATTRTSSSAQDVHTAGLYLALTHIYPPFFAAETTE